MKNIDGPIWLSNASWIVLFLSWNILHGGLHPEQVTINFINFYAGNLVVLFNVPLAVGLILKMVNHKEFLFLEILHFVLKVAIGYYLIKLSSF